MKPEANLIALSAAATIALSPVVLAVEEDESTPGNRYDKPRLYHSEISASEAYLLMEEPWTTGVKKVGTGTAKGPH